MKSKRMALLAALAVGAGAQFAPAVVLVGGVAASLSVSGCAATPKRAYFETQELYIAAVTVANSAFDAGKIDRAAWREKWNPKIQEGSRLLTAIETAINAGDQDTAQTLRRMLMAILAELNQMRAALPQEN